VLLARKITNASELLWDSLDERERMIVVYAAAWTVVVGLLSLRQRSRDRFRRELVAEHGGA